MASIFISYRRADSEGYARMIYQNLVSRFGEEQVHELRILVSEERPGGESIVTELRSMEMRTLRRCEAVQNISRINISAAAQRVRPIEPPSSPNPFSPDPA